MERWIRNPQRLYKKGFHSRIRRENKILLKSLQTFNQIDTHILILSQVDSKVPTEPLKILLFRSNQIAHRVAEAATFHRIFPFLEMERLWPRLINSEADRGVTQTVPNSFKCWTKVRMKIHNAGKDDPLIHCPFCT